MTDKENACKELKVGVTNLEKNIAEKDAEIEKINSQLGNEREKSKEKSNTILKHTDTISHLESNIVEKEERVTCHYWQLEAIMGSYGQLKAVKGS